MLLIINLCNVCLVKTNFNDYGNINSRLNKNLICIIFHFFEKKADNKNVLTLSITRVHYLKLKKLFHK